MTTVTAISSGLRVIAAVTVTEFEGQGMPSNGFRDRRIVVTLDCDHTKRVSIPLNAPLPIAGELSRCLACSCRGMS